MADKLKPLVIIGAGGLGREVAWLVTDINRQKREWDFVGFVDDGVQGRTPEGYPVLGTLEYFFELSSHPWVVVAIADSQVSMVSCGVKHLVFSSTVAVYGEPDVTPITEDAKLDPTNVYGASKLMVEQILEWYSKIYPISYVSLRCFNASGADESGLFGEWHNPETHLIPIVLQYALGQRNQLIVYGDDYDTTDGTCIRDYIHVTDLAKAHVLALEALNEGMDSRIFNLGNGSGYSVKEIISCTEDILGRPIPYTIGSRRPGDSAALIASSDRIRRDLGWRPRYNELSDIVRTAWKWHSSNLIGVRTWVVF